MVFVRSFCDESFENRFSGCEVAFCNRIFGFLLCAVFVRHEELGKAFFQFVFRKLSLNGILHLAIVQHDDKRERLQTEGLDKCHIFRNVQVDFAERKV